MKKIAIVCTEAILENRLTGVRASLIAQYFNLKESAEVDFFYYENASLTTVNDKSAFRLNYFRVDFTEDDIYNNFHSVDIIHKKRPYFLEKFLKNKAKKPPLKYKVYASSIDDYDTILYPAPWFACVTPDLVGKKICVIWHDYFLSTNPFTRRVSSNAAVRSAVANINIQNCLKMGAEFWYQSKYALDQFNQVYSSHPNYNPENLIFLKNLVLKPFLNLDLPREKENSAVIANMFDPRKKPYESIKILQNLDVDKVYIFGVRRCSRKDYVAILKGIYTTGKEVVHYDIVSNATLAEIYAKAKYLIFPSEDEGLGIPILEAQAMGCEVILSEKMKSLRECETSET